MSISKRHFVKLAEILGTVKDGPERSRLTRLISAFCSDENPSFNSFTFTEAVENRAPGRTPATRVKDLKLGDTVKLFDGAFGTGIVTQVTDKGVTIFRPYGTTADFSYTGGVIPYTGTEICQYEIDSSAEFEVHYHRTLR